MQGTALINSPRRLESFGNRRKVTSVTLEWFAQLTAQQVVVQGSLFAVLACTIQENDERYLHMYLTKMPYDQNMVRNGDETWPLYSLWIVLLSRPYP